MNRDSFYSKTANYSVAFSSREEYSFSYSL